MRYLVNKPLFFLFVIHAKQAEAGTSGATQLLLL